MKKTTIWTAWLWIAAVIVSTAWGLAIGSIRSNQIVFTSVYAVFTVIPAVSLLKGKVNGWRALALLCAYVALSSVMTALFFPSSGKQHHSPSLPMFIVSAVCFTGLVSDRPKQWREMEQPSGMSVLDVLTVLVLVVLLIMVALTIPGLLIGGLDYIFSFFRGVMRVVFR